MNKMRLSVIRKRELPKLSLIIALFLLLSSVVRGQEQIRTALPAPKGILVFAGMELADGNRIDYYSVERSYDQRRWEIITGMKSPSGWDEFYAAFRLWEPDFGFQGIPGPADLMEGWHKCGIAGVIDSMGYWASSTGVRLAAGLAFYDQEAQEGVRVWYRTRAVKDGKVVSELLSAPAEWPFVPQFDPLTLSERNVDKNVFYLKWQSQGTNPAPGFAIRYYEGDQLYEAEGATALYHSGNTTFYIFQDSTKHLTRQRQYFLNPTDLYGNRGAATEIVLLSGTTASPTFFRNLKAVTDTTDYGVLVNWQLQNRELLKGINIFRSSSYDEDEYELLATLPPDDNSYTDRMVDPDRMYYYYLETVSDREDTPKRSAIVFNSALDRLQPLFPSIHRGDDVAGGITVRVRATDLNLAGVKIYRSDGITPGLYPVTDILPLTENEVVYSDTSAILSGELSFLYAATSVNTSSVESIFSDTLAIHPGIRTIPPTPVSLSAFEEDNAVRLVWEDVRSRHIITRGYRLYRRDLPDGRLAPLLPADSVITVPMFTDMTAEPGKSYEYAVETIDDLGGVSGQMTAAQLTLRALRLPIPPPLRVTAEEGRVTVQWAEPVKEQLLTLSLYRYQRGEEPLLLKRITNEVRSYADKTVKKGELYFYYTTFTDGKGNVSARSQEAGIRAE